MPKGTSQAEAMLNSEKINLVALVIIELYLTEGISQAVSQKKIPLNKIFLKILWKLFERILDQSESVFGLSFTKPIMFHRHLGKLRLVFR